MSSTRGFLYSPGEIRPCKLGTVAKRGSHAHHGGDSLRCIRRCCSATAGALEGNEPAPRGAPHVVRGRRSAGFPAFSAAWRTPLTEHGGRCPGSLPPRRFKGAEHSVLVPFASFAHGRLSWVFRVVFLAVGDRWNKRACDSLPRRRNRALGPSIGNTTRRLETPTAAFSCSRASSRLKAAPSVEGRPDARPAGARRNERGVVSVILRVRTSGGGLVLEGRLSPTPGVRLDVTVYLTSETSTPSARAI
jgi:hypothetical protein